MREYNYAGKDGNLIGTIWQVPDINNPSVWDYVRMRICDSRVQRDLKSAETVLLDYALGMVNLMAVYAEWNLDVGKRIEKQ